MNLFRRFRPGGFVPGGPVPATPMPGERIIPLKNLGAIRQIDQQLRAGEIDADEYARRFEELTLPWG